MRFLTCNEHAKILRCFGWNEKQIKHEWSTLPTAYPYHKFVRSILRQVDARRKDAVVWK